MEYLIEVPTGASLKLRAGVNIGMLKFGTTASGLNPIFKVTGGTLDTYLCRLGGDVDGSGTVNSNDVQKLLNYIRTGAELTNEHLADVDDIRNIVGGMQ